MKTEKLKWVAKAIVFGGLIFSAVTLGTMYLWNHLAVSVFGLPHLSYLQTLGLMILGRLLSGGFKGGGHWHHRGGMMHRGRFWKERWQNMSEEERQQFMNRWGKRGCRTETPSQETNS